jgi:hypothetical protein
MIDPRETRPMICRFGELMQPVLARLAARKRQEDGQRPVRP